MKKILFLAAAFLICTAMISLQSCQSTKSATATKMLKFNFETGKGYDYEMTMSMDQDIMGQPMKMNMASYYSMDVTADNGASKTITSYIDRIKMNMNMAGMDFTVDSENKTAADDKNPMAMMNKIFGAVTGRRFVMKVNAEGKVEEVTGVNVMAGAMADSMGLEGNDRKEMMEKFSQSFNEKQMKGQFERFLYIFPNKEVKVGDTWDRSSEVSGQMAGKYKSTYTVKEIEGDMVTLEEKTKIEGEMDQADNLNGKVSGVLVVDSKSGLVVNADQDIVMNLEKSGQKITINAKSKIKGKAR